MTQPTLSIITVNFNNNKGLIATLNSIKNQSFTSYEHIIIDACSTDGSKETIIKYSKETSHLAYWVSEKDNGIYDGMNKGIEHASGEYLYFLNSGDCLIKDVLRHIPFDGTQYIYGNIKLYQQTKIHGYGNTQIDSTHSFLQIQKVGFHNKLVLSTIHYS